MCSTAPATPASRREADRLGAPPRPRPPWSSRAPLRAMTGSGSAARAVRGGRGGGPAAPAPQVVEPVTAAVDDSQRQRCEGVAGRPARDDGVRAGGSRPPDDLPRDAEPPQPCTVEHLLKAREQHVLLVPDV